MVGSGQAGLYSGPRSSPHCRAVPRPKSPLPLFPPNAPHIYPMPPPPLFSPPSGLRPVDHDSNARGEGGRLVLSNPPPSPPPGAKGGTEVHGARGILATPRAEGGKRNVMLPANYLPHSLTPFVSSPAAFVFCIEPPGPNGSF